MVQAIKAILAELAECAVRELETGLMGSCRNLHTHLEVVWTHKQVGNALAHHTHDPLIKVLGLALSCGVGHFRLNEASQAVDLQDERMSLTAAGNSQNAWIDLCAGMVENRHGREVVQKLREHAK